MIPSIETIQGDLALIKSLRLPEMVDNLEKQLSVVSENIIEFLPVYNNVITVAEVLDLITPITKVPDFEGEAKVYEAIKPLFDARNRELTKTPELYINRRILSSLEEMDILTVDELSRLSIPDMLTSLGWAGLRGTLRLALVLENYDLKPADPK